jgi:hypothetical protein
MQLFSIYWDGCHAALMPYDNPKPVSCAWLPQLLDALGSAAAQRAGTCVHMYDGCRCDAGDTHSQLHWAIVLLVLLQLYS